MLALRYVPWPLTLILFQRLIETGHNVLVWSTSVPLRESLKQFAKGRKSYFKIFKFPGDLVKQAHIIFSCLSSVEEVKAMLGELGLDDKRDHTLRKKYYVEMSAIDFETSYTINNYMQRKRAKYMEAMVRNRGFLPCTFFIFCFVEDWRHFRRRRESVRPHFGERGNGKGRKISVQMAIVFLCYIEGHMPRRRHWGRHQIPRHLPNDEGRISGGLHRMPGHSW